MMCNRPSIFASVRLYDGPHGMLAGEHAATLGIDVQALLPAPGGECVWIDYGANDDLALALDVALESLGLFFPLVETGRQSISIRHDRENARIVLASVPGHPDGGGDIESAREISVIQGLSPSDGGLSNSIEGCPPVESQGPSGGYPQVMVPANEEYSALQALRPEAAKGSLPLLPGALVDRMRDGGSQNASMQGRSNVQGKHRCDLLAVQSRQGRHALLQVSQVDLSQLAERAAGDGLDLGIAAHLDANAPGMHQHSIVGGLNHFQSALVPAMGVAA